MRNPIWRRSDSGPKFVGRRLGLLAVLLIVAGCSDGAAVPPGEVAEHVGNVVLVELGIDAALLDGTDLQVSGCTDYAGVPNGYEDAVFSTGWTAADSTVVDEMIGRLHSAFHARFLPDWKDEVEGRIYAQFFRSESGGEINDDLSDFVEVVVWVDPSGAFTMTVSTVCARGHGPVLRAVGETSAGGV